MIPRHSKSIYSHYPYLELHSLGTPRCLLTLFVGDLEQKIHDHFSPTVMS
jgi:hypothetical protein